MEYIKKWHDDIIKNPERHCESIHLLKALVEKWTNSEELYYDDLEVESVIEFCSLCCHIEGKWAGKPLILNDVQKYIVSCVFGIKEKLTGKRYFREAIVIVARKFGKSTFLASLCLYMLIADGEKGAQIWTLATVKAQAEIVYKHAVNMAKKSPELSKYVRTRKVSDAQILEFPSMDSWLKAGSKDVDSKDGLNPHFVCIDELHAIKKRNTYDVMSSATGAREQPIIFIISTSGFERDNIFDQMYNASKRILRSEIPDNRRFPCIFEIDDDDDWKNEKCYIKANPGLGETPKLEYLIQQRNNAMNDIELLPSFLSKHLNRASNASVIYFNMQDVNKCATDLAQNEYTDVYAVGGVDLAETTDLCNATCLIPKGNGEFLMLQKYFVAEKRINEMSFKDRKAYEAFKDTDAIDEASKSVLEICEGSFVSAKHVTAWFCYLRDQFDITFVRIGYDTWHSSMWAEDMELNGFPKCHTRKDELIGTMLPVIQGAKTLSQPMKETKKMFSDNLLKYSRYNGLFRWCCNNTAARIDINNNIQPDKAKSNGRIDGYAGFLNSLVAYNSVKNIIESYI